MYWRDWSLGPSRCIGGDGGRPLQVERHADVQAGCCQRRREPLVQCAGVPRASDGTKLYHLKEKIPSEHIAARSPLPAGLRRLLATSPLYSRGREGL